MTEHEPGHEEDREPTPRKMDSKSLAIVLAFGLALVLLIALNMN
jgi:hypothetical protein